MIDFRRGSLLCWSIFRGCRCQNAIFKCYQRHYFIYEVQQNCCPLGIARTPLGSLRLFSKSSRSVAYLEIGDRGCVGPILRNKRRWTKARCRRKKCLLSLVSNCHTWLLAKSHVRHTLVEYIFDQGHTLHIG